MPGGVAGIAVPDARERRVLVDDGRLVLVHGGTVVAVLAERGEVTRVVAAEPSAVRRPRRGRWPEPPLLGMVALFAGARPVAAFSVVDWVPDPSLPSVAEARHVSGLEAVARDLDLVVEAASADEVRALREAGRRVLVAPRSVPVATTWGRVLAVWWALFTALFTTQAGGLGLGLVWYAVTTALVLPVAVRFCLERRRFVALADSVPPPEGRTVLRPALPAETGGLARAELQVGSDHLVVHDRGHETWVPGPLIGGVTRAERTPSALTLTDRRGRPVLVLDDLVWTGGDPARAAALDEALRDVGIEVAADHAAPPTAFPAQSRFGSARAAATRSATAQMAFVEHGGGSAAVGAFLALAAPLHVVSALACWTYAGWAAVLLVPSLASVVLVATAWWSLHRWDRRQRTRPLSPLPHETTVT